MMLWYIFFLFVRFNVSFNLIGWYVFFDNDVDNCSMFVEKGDFVMWFEVGYVVKMEFIVNGNKNLEICGEYFIKELYMVYFYY